MGLGVTLGVQPLVTEHFLCTRPWASAGNMHLGEQELLPRLVGVTVCAARMWRDQDSWEHGGRK